MSLLSLTCKQSTGIIKDALDSSWNRFSPPQKPFAVDQFMFLNSHVEFLAPSMTALGDNTYKEINKVK